MSLQHFHKWEMLMGCIGAYLPDDKVEKQSGAR